MNNRQLALILIGGVVFGFGLAMSTLVRPEVVLSFLRLDDLGLAVTMAVALAVALPIYQLMPRLLTKPPVGTMFERAPRRITQSSVVGGVIFGIGWGVSGVCPGAAVASVGIGNWPIVFALVGIALGAYLQGVVATRSSARPGTFAVE